MPPRPKKKAQPGILVQSSSAPPPIKAFTVHESGSRKALKFTESASSKSRSAAAAADEDNLLVLNQEIAEEWDNEFLFPSDSLAQDSAPVDSAPIDSAPYAAVAEPEDPLDEGLNSLLPKSQHGKGQSEMLQQWLMVWSIIYLAQLFQHHSPPTTPCICGAELADVLYTCDDCLSRHRICHSCLMARHVSMPTHRIRKWNGYAWSKTSLQAEGFELSLGAHDGVCPNRIRRDFTLGDVTGLHTITLAFCGCANAAEQNMQLLQVNIMPCSDANPSSGFTFACLRMFHFASTESKLSASRFYSILERSTNNLMPHLHLDRLREFM
ncbi:hypothetical protein FRC12_022182 [Ceratobasidium sp. 428]|nr:hypothetical protein FRC12_022182 [Ceratobasidium sp. 428]